MCFAENICSSVYWYTWGPDGFSARSAIFCCHWGSSFSGRNNQAIGPRLSAIFTFLSMHPPTPISHFLIFSFLIFLHKAIPVSKSSIICKFLIYKTFIVFVKASWTKDSKGVVVLTTPSLRTFLISHCHSRDRNPFVWRATQKFIFSNFSNVKSSKDCKSLKFRNCLKTGQLNCLHNHLIYKACPKTGQASLIPHHHSIHWPTRLWTFCSKPAHTLFFVHWKNLLRKFGCVDEKMYLCGVN